MIVMRGKVSLKKSEQEERIQKMIFRGQGTIGMGSKKKKISQQILSSLSKKKKSVSLNRAV